MDSLSSPSVKNNTKTIVRLIFLGTALVLVFFHFSHPLNSDEGVLLSAAWEMYNGQDLYTDIFEFIPPLSFYLVYFMFVLFGPSYIIAKVLSLIFISLAAFGIYRLSSLFSGSYLNYFLPLLFVLSTLNWPVIHYHTFSIGLSVWVVYLFIKSLKSKSDRLFLFTGFLLGIATPLLLSVTLVLIYEIIKNKNVIINLLELIGAFLLPQLTLLLFWPGSLLYKNLIEFPLVHYQEVARVPLLFFSIFLLAASASWLVFKKESRKEIHYLLFIQILLVLSTFALADHYHLLLIIFPLWSLLPLLLEKIKQFNFHIRLTLWLFLAIFLGFIYLPAFSYLSAIPPFYSIKNHPLLTYIDKNCRGNGYIFAGPFIPGVYFEARLLNPTSYPYLIPRHNSVEHFAQATRELNQNPPPCAILNYSIVAKYGYTSDNLVEKFIQNEYKLAENISRFYIYHLKK
jgi:hypothetical protein